MSYELDDTILYARFLEREVSDASDILRRVLNGRGFGELAPGVQEAVTEWVDEHG
jgi:hypothetical protein